MVVGKKNKRNGRVVKVIDCKSIEKYSSWVQIPLSLENRVITQIWFSVSILGIESRGFKSLFLEEQLFLNLK